MAKPYALAGSARTQGEIRRPTTEPSQPPRGPNGRGNGLLRSGALALSSPMNLSESYKILLHLEITGDRDHVTPQSIGAGTSTLATSTPRKVKV